jgi:hypothetical protein
LNTLLLRVVVAEVDHGMAVAMAQEVVVRVDI